MKPRWCTGIAVIVTLAGACNNVVPAAVEQELRRQQAAEQDHARSVRELWVLDTDKGRIVIRLFPDEAPATVAQVRAWTAAGVYDGTWFHRVVREPRPFLVQAGDPESAHIEAPPDAAGRRALADGFGFGTTGPALVPETTARKHTAGAVALAVREDGRRAGPQFVIALAPLAHLDGQEPVFGQVEGGWSVVGRLDPGDRIRRAQLLSPGRIAGDWTRDLPPSR